MIIAGVSRPVRRNIVLDHKGFSAKGRHPWSLFPFPRSVWRKKQKWTKKVSTAPGEAVNASTVIHWSRSRGVPVADRRPKKKKGARNLTPFELIADAMKGLDEVAPRNSLETNLSCASLANRLGLLLGTSLLLRLVFAIHHLLRSTLTTTSHGDSPS